MSRGLRLGGRVFAPSAGFTVLTLLLCALLLRLGVWQWHKGIQRQEQWTRFARGADQVIALFARALSAVPLFERVSVTGRLDGARQFLLDNRSYRGRAGYGVLTPLTRADAAVLLSDRGWVPSTGTRARLPDIAFEAAAPVTLSGRIAELPSPGLASGRSAPEARAAWPKVTSYPSLAALFLLPLVVAFFTYYGSPWRPARRVNHGVLITPARPLPPVRLPQRRGAAAAHGTPLRGTWSLVYVGNGACDGACRQALWVMRQTRLALNNDMTRVQRVFLVSAECCAGELLGREQAGLEILDAAGPAGAALLREFPSPGRAHSLFVVDPLGNLMMSYDARRDPHGLLEDLKKLLKLSHIG